MPLKVKKMMFTGKGFVLSEGEVVCPNCNDAKMKQGSTCPKCGYVSSANKKLVAFILDETASMESVKNKTILGFNEYIQTLKNEEDADNILFTLVKFNSQKTERVYDGEKIKTVADLTENSYRPQAITPLYDTIGSTIHATSMVAREKGANVLFVIQTDGEENASKEYNRKMIFDLIDEKKKDGWSFVFLGADQDAYLASEGLGISSGNTMSYSSGDTVKMFNAVARGTSSYVQTGGEQTNSFFDDESEKES